MQSGLSSSDWFTTLSFVFGGCCSNAITLEQLTSENPESGVLITFLQFLLISIHGLPNHITFSDPRAIQGRAVNGKGSKRDHSQKTSLWNSLPRLRPRRVPLLVYVAQVVLFYTISTLNNAAFAYHIPMTVHIIFRSGGLIVNLALGWLVAKKKYSYSQIISVCMVTIGIASTTFSASQPDSRAREARPFNVASYTRGILMLTLALLLSGILGLAQDWTFKRYIHRAQKTSQRTSAVVTDTKQSSPWQESMFYLHFLAMPLFYFSRHNLADQMIAISSGPKAELSITPLSPMFSPFLPVFPVVRIPLAYIFILLNAFTQFFCVSGVNRMTGRVSSLSVTLILVVRKAASMLLSVAVYGGRGSTTMWFGAVLVLLGTVGYSLGGSVEESKKQRGKKVKKI